MMIANSGSDERGKYRGGSAGDQNGKEWQIRNWYNRPWRYVLRHPDKATRELIAQMAEAAAKNNHIGYDQGQRHTFFAELQKANYIPEDIKTKCEADCSSGVCGIVKGAGYRLNDKALQSISSGLRTGTMLAPFKKAGFAAYTSTKLTKSDKYLLRGDILLLPNGHTAINLTNGSLSGSITSTSGIITVKEWQLAAIADGYKFADYGADGLWGRECEAVAKKAIIKKRLIPANRNLTKLVQRLLGQEQDGICGNDTVEAIKAYQRSNGLEADGIIGLMTWRKILT
jgi:hypothetical protein